MIRDIKASRPCQRVRGFTLLEVLVAVAIVALGLSGVLATVNGMVGSSAYLRDKTLANWVAQNHITELRLEPTWPELGKSTDEEEMAGQRWHIATVVLATPVEELRRIDVSVAYAETRDEPLVTVAAFVGRTSAVGPRPDWRAGVDTNTPIPDQDGDDADGDNTDNTDNTDNSGGNDKVDEDTPADGTDGS